VLIHPWDAPADPAEVFAFVRAQGFGHLIAPGTREVPVVVPTQYVVDDSPIDDSTAGVPDVLLHLARPNPIWAAIAESSTVLLSVAGDWAYVPSAWKAVGEEDPALGIPTTYYAAAQLLGDAEVLDDEDAKLDVLRRQLAALEPDIDHADPSVHLRRLPGIRAIRIRVRDVAGKFKYGGNVDAAHRAAVAANLEAAVGHLRRRSPDL
jgi:transcriptional regulator